MSSTLIIIGVLLFVSLINFGMWTELKKYRRSSGGPGVIREPRALEHLFPEYYRPEARTLLTWARILAVVDMAVTIWLVYFAVT